MKRLTYSKPCPGECGGHIDRNATMCRPCRKARRIATVEVEDIDNSSHASRMSSALARAAHVASPARLLALAIVGQCIDDVRFGQEASVAPFWVHAAEVPEEWVRDAGVFVGDAITPITLRRTA